MDIQAKPVPDPISERQQNPVSLPDYFKGVAYDAEMKSNATQLLTRVNRFLQVFGQFRRVRWGYVPSAEANAARPNPSLRSKHLTAQAVDLEDPEGDLDQFVMDNQQLLEKCGLWVQHPAGTKGYCHMQSVPPLSGRRIFYP